MNLKKFEKRKIALSCKKLKYGPTTYDTIFVGRLFCIFVISVIRKQGAGLRRYRLPIRYNHR